VTIVTVVVVVRARTKEKIKGNEKKKDQHTPNVFGNLILAYSNLFVPGAHPEFFSWGGGGELTLRPYIIYV
jgi:hypothetical protein